MARAWATRPSALLGVPDPLLAFQFDSAVFSLEEAIEGALERARRQLDLKELDAKGRRKVLDAEAAMKRVLDRILGTHAERLAEEARRVERPVEYLWDEGRTVIVGWRYADEAAGA